MDNRTTGKNPLDLPACLRHIQDFKLGSLLLVNHRKRHYPFTDAEAAARSFQCAAKRVDTCTNVRENLLERWKFWISNNDLKYGGKDWAQEYLVPQAQFDSTVSKKNRANCDPAKMLLHFKYIATFMMRGIPAAVKMIISQTGAKSEYSNYIWVKFRS